MSGNGHRTFRYSVPITFIKRCKKIQRTRKNTISCARQGLKHLRSYSPQVHCNGCTEQQPMMTAGKSATSLCLATSWQGWLLRTARPKVSTDRLCFQSVRRSIPKNSFQPGRPENETFFTPATLPAMPCMMLKAVVRSVRSSFFTEATDEERSRLASVP